MSGPKKFNCGPLVVYNTPDNFSAGKISKFLANWYNLTSDSWVLKVVFGYELEFDHPVFQNCLPKTIQFSEGETEALDLEVQKFVRTGIVEFCGHDEGEFISHIFPRLKRDGSWRIILNLKDLNESIEKIHFKMETLRSAILLMKPHSYFASIDLKDAYFSVNIAEHSRKFLKFWWKGNLYRFTCLPQGLSSSPRVFTKLTKPVLASLREQGLANVLYIDDCFLQSDSYSDCLFNIKQTVDLLDSLGFTIHPTKSVLEPVKEIEFLGFLLNSEDMTVRLTPRKVSKIVSFCSELISKPSCTIRQLAELVGNLTATLPGVVFGPLFIKPLEIAKDQALRLNKGNFDSSMELHYSLKEVLNWWVVNLPKTRKHVLQSKPDFDLYTDSSTSGWGGVFGEIQTGGFWSMEESKLHINVLELKACLLSLQSLCANLKNTHIRIFSDNVVTVTYIDRMGGMKPDLNNLARDIWFWAMERHIWLSAAHIAGKDNLVADKLSRESNFDLEWKLCPFIFDHITKLLGEPIIDLFASRLNSQLPRYVAWRPDPNAEAIDAFKLDWSNFNCSYIFPPFSVLGAVLQKVDQDQAEVIVIAPMWTTQSWYPHLLRLLSAQPILLPRHKWVLQLPQKPEKLHPLHKTLQMIACRLSGKPSVRKTFQEELQTLSWPLGGSVRKSSTEPISPDGLTFVVNNKCIRFRHLLK